jgi:chromosome segregation and condensation protein ScpB
MRPDNVPDGQEEPSVVAAMASKLASGTPPSELEHDRALLEMIRLARSRGLSQTQIAAVLGLPVWRYKQILKRLEAEVRRREIVAATEEARLRG